MYHRETLADHLGDRVVYRNLRPADPNLPGLEDIWQEVGLERCRVPRKTEPAYAAVVLRLLGAAQRQRSSSPLRNVIFIGDMPLSDVTAARYLASHLPLRGFIGADRLHEPAELKAEGDLTFGNRWGQLLDWLDRIAQEHFEMGEQTAVLVDIDKTYIGARGRNDHVIDQARLEAVRLTVEEVLAGAFDEEAFRAVYRQLYQPKYHFLTADNQDYLAYISLMVMGNVIPSGEFWVALQNGQLKSFDEFVALCEHRRACMPDGLATVHQEVLGNLQRDDPTPFKSFRYREFLTTVARIDYLPDETPRAELLANEIVITQEVSQAMDLLAKCGALLFATSDKPDEASNPPASLSPGSQKSRPIHRLVMKSVSG